MTEYKRINERPIFLLMKYWFGGKIEFVGAYWEEEKAKQVAAENLPRNGQTFSLTLNEITLHGCMLDFK